jgi:DNA-directed RNA polymerases I, II, and III subunit RPABC1
MDAEEINRLYRVWRTLMQMMQDRGYHIPEPLLMITLNAFRQKLLENKSRECLIVQLAKEDEPDSKVLLYFDDSPRITVPIIANIAQKMHKDSIKRAVIVGKGTITPSAKQAIVEVQSHFIIEFFEEKELLVNITEHELVPKHIVMSEAEKMALLKRYRVKESQLPKIQIGDPVARYFGLSRGQVVKIIRTSETAGKYITYRLAV